MDGIAVIDYGSNTFKAGFTFPNYPDESEPKILTPNAVEVVTPDNPDVPVAHRYPVHAGQITDFDAFESLLHYSLYELLGWALGDEGNIMVSEPILTSRPDRERVAQLMFEVFNANGVFFQDQAVCSMHAANRTSGLVVDIGHAKVDVAVVMDGLLSSSSATRLPYGGEHLTHHLQHLLEQRGTPVASLHDAEVLKEAIMRCCASRTVFLDATAQAARSGAGSSSGNGAQAIESFTLPDGQQVLVACEGLCLGEALFDPSMLGSSQPGIAQAAFTATLGLDTVTRKASYENVLLCGGGAVTPGLATRLALEVSLHSGCPSAAVAPLPDYMPQARATKYCAWMGAAILGKVVLSANQFVGKADYEELGPSCVWRKCP